MVLLYSARAGNNFSLFTRHNKLCPFQIFQIQTFDNFEWT